MKVFLLCRVLGRHKPVPSWVSNKWRHSYCERCKLDLCSPA